MQNLISQSSPKTAKLNSAKISSTKISFVKADLIKLVHWFPSSDPKNYLPQIYNTFGSAQKQCSNFKHTRLATCFHKLSLFWLCIRSLVQHFWLCQLVLLFCFLDHWLYIFLFPFFAPYRTLECKLTVTNQITWY